MLRLPWQPVTSLSFAFLAPLALAQPMLSGPASDPHALFVPNNRVPLSEFVSKTNLTVAMHVEPAILAWITSHGGSVKVALKKPNGQIAMFNPTSVAGNTVTLTATTNGKCVVVGTNLTHVLSADVAHSIATHWDGSLAPNGRSGRQSFGAKDGIGILDYDVVNGVESSGGVSLIGSAGGFYTYKVDEYNLFSDGSGDAAVEFAKTPDRERFIAETYSTAAPTNLRAVFLSDYVRQKTGRPVAHRNAGPTQGVDLSLVLQEVQLDLPVFQLVHGHVVDIGDDCACGDAGNENSLATLMLPPHWTSNVAGGTYPVLFNGFYDNLGSTFGWTGKNFFEAIGEVYNDSSGDDRAVGIVWNGGGGSNVTTTLHESAFYNAQTLLANAASLLKADVNYTIFVGGSRGGTTALAMASNPLGAPYRAAYVNAASAQVKLGEMFPRYVNPVYQLAQGSVDLTTGYAGSWPSDWVVPAGEPHAGMSRDDFCKTILFGTTVAGEISAFHTADSPQFIAALEAQDPDPILILHMTTHDYSRPFLQMAEYVNNLESTGLTVLCNVEYRFGHTFPTGVGPSHAELLERVFIEKEGGTQPPLTNNPGGVEVRYFAADPNDPDPTNPTTAVELASPPHVPLIVEAPLSVGCDQAFTVVVCGEPGASIRFDYSRTVAAWDPVADSCQGCSAAGGTCLYHVPYPTCFDQPPISLAHQLSSGTVFGTLVLDLDSQNFQSQREHWYEAWYGLEAGADPQFGQGDQAWPIQSQGPFAHDKPVFTVLPEAAGDPACERFGAAVLARTGGVSGDRPYLP